MVLSQQCGAVDLFNIITTSYLLHASCGRRNTSHSLNSLHLSLIEGRHYGAKVSWWVWREAHNMDQYRGEYRPNVSALA